MTTPARRAENRCTQAVRSKPRVKKKSLRQISLRLCSKSRLLLIDTVVDKGVQRDQAELGERGTRGLERD